MRLSELSKCLLALLRGDAVAPLDWEGLMRLASNQGVLAIAYDRIVELSESGKIDVPKPIILKWIAASMAYEKRYSKYEIAISRLAQFYNEHGFKMMLLKGYGLSLNYPIPKHRTCGDIDIWNYGEYKAADKALKEEKGVRIDDSKHHHTVFYIGGFMVENHYNFLNVHSHKSNMGIEKRLLQLVEPCETVNVTGQTVYLPSPNFNALFLLVHSAKHFAAAELNLRQLQDWAYFVAKYSEQIDWNSLYSDCKKWNKDKFLNVINAICVDYLGFNPKDFPIEENDEELEDQVLAEILEPEFSEEFPKGYLKILSFKYRRWRASEWKNNIVYPESQVATFFRQLWSHILKPASILSK